jgi:hypothetical protein
MRGVNKDGDSAFYVTEGVLERYIIGFDRPCGEGETRCYFHMHCSRCIIYSLVTTIRRLAGI